MRVECYFDGACEPVNPSGHTSYGAIVKCDGKTIFSESGYVGVGEGMSNNVGEYAGCIAVLKFLIQEKVTEGIIYGDSKLVIKQLDRKWKAKHGMYLPYFKDAIKLRCQLPNIKLQWISRWQNTEADWLSKQAIKSVPHADAKREELKRLIKEQRADARDRRLKFVKVIRDGEVIASRPVKGAPF